MLCSTFLAAVLLPEPGAAAAPGAGWRVFPGGCQAAVRGFHARPGMGVSLTEPASARQLGFAAPQALQTDRRCRRVGWLQGTYPVAGESPVSPGPFEEWLGAERRASEPVSTHRGACSSLPCALLEDLRELVLRPGRLGGDDWRVLGRSALAVGLVGLADETVRNRVQETSSASSRGFAERLRPVTLWGPLAGAAAAWAVTRFGSNERARAVAQDGLEAVMLSVLVVVPAIKELVGRARPSAGLGAGHFRPFSRHESFVSGDVAQAFALASVAHSRGAPQWLRTGLWIFAGAAAWSRIELDRHWASDVVAGALVGIAIGRWVAGRGCARSQGRLVRVGISTVPGGLMGVAAWQW